MTAANAADRYGFIWTEVNCLVVRQRCEDELIAMFGEPFANKYKEKNAFITGS